MILAEMNVKGVTHASVVDPYELRHLQHSLRYRISES